LLEAMAAGLPVIGTRVASTMEAVEDGKTGFIVDPDDVDGLAKAILTLANDTGLRAAMGQAGRTRAELRFGWPAIANVWLEATARIARPWDRTQRDM
jgi:glycosyltransferase involved in cell wall biosynthesis